MSGAPQTTIADLFVEHVDAMVSRARRVLGTEADAEDAVQEVMLALLSGPHVLASVDRVGAWLLTLARRRAIDLIRSDSRRRQRECAQGIDELFASADDPDELLRRDDVARLVADELEQMPAPLREAFVRTALDGATFRELSEQSGEPMGTLMARKKRATDRIRERLRRAHVLP